MTTVDLSPLLHIRVLGTPRPKGSLRPFVKPSGKPGAREQHGHSTDWRGLVCDAAYKAIMCTEDASDNTTGYRPGYPYQGAVKVIIALEFIRPKARPSSAPKGSPPEEWLPATRATGDVEKQARNIHDALQDAGVIRDDAQVVNLEVSARYTAGAPSAEIIVWPVMSALPGGETPTPPPDGAEPMMPTLKLFPIGES